jgi:hypothetical protein
MKLKEKFKQFIIIIMVLLLSYSLCSTHELPSQGYISRRKSFCSMPFYVIVLFSILIIFFM